MILHLYIDGQERLCKDVAPGRVQDTLREVERCLPALMSSGRLCVALDSAAHANVTYLIRPINQPS